MIDLKTNWPFNLNGRVYRLVMRIAHRYNWHYAPPIYPEDDIQLWCKWCGFRMTLPKPRKDAISAEPANAQQGTTLGERG